MKAVEGILFLETSLGLLGLAALMVEVSQCLLGALCLSKDLLQLLCQLYCSCNLDLSADNAARSLSDNKQVKLKLKKRFSNDVSVGPSQPWYTRESKKIDQTK
jgi:hypothetical protein